MNSDTQRSGPSASMDKSPLASSNGSIPAPLDQSSSASFELASESASSLLRNAREAKNLTQKDIADRLYLTPAFIQYIDADELDRISKQAFVRGYLRAYAKLVDVNDDVVVKLYERANNIAPTKTAIKSDSGTSIGAVSFTGPVFMTGLVGVVALLLVVAIVWFVSADEATLPEQVIPIETVEYVTNEMATPDSPAFELDESRSIDGEAESDNPESLTGEADINAAESDVASVPKDIEPATIGVVTNSDLSETDQSILSSADFIVTRDTDGDTRVVNIDSGGEDVLDFVFTGDCWLEVRDANNQMVYGDLGGAGLNIRIQGLAPFRIVIGNTSALVMRYQGEAFDLKPHTTPRKTATLNVGE